MRRKRSDVRRGVLGKQLQIFNQNQSRAKKKRKVSIQLNASLQFSVKKGGKI